MNRIVMVLCIVLAGRPALRADVIHALVDARGHRHRAANVLAGLQRRDALPAVVGNRRVDVHHVHIRILDQLLEIRVALFNPEGVSHGVQLVLRPLANRVHIRLRMPLVDGNELRPKAESDDGDVYAAVFSFGFGWHNYIGEN